ncbi:unnamed protein product [Miscanthus lutarioriparius]|uniref:NAD-dependent epimerase/dehydratase domain-containing protein n=1 Tax=Miscanthus lutarioriparius TaxID=422564 RepID=A0A811NEY8_9POAL|nr:unnamed protein product [Miscanthus lutarioriparius]
MPTAETTTPVPALSGQGRTVCVTGAGGFIASWLVKRLLEKGYTVRGTVRNPGSLVEAFSGCDGVFHAASPVTDHPEMMIEPAIRGTRYVMTAAADTGVKRVVLTSSIDLACWNPNDATGRAVGVTSMQRRVGVMDGEARGWILGAVIMKKDGELALFLGMRRR